MARSRLDWDNVRADSSAGTGAFISGSKMLASALDNLKAPLDRGNQIVLQNATAERDANTGALMRAIYKGENPELSGAYDSGVLADAGYQYDKDQIALGFKRRAEGRAISNAAQRVSDATALNGFYSDGFDEYSDVDTPNNIPNNNPNILTDAIERQNISLNQQNINTPDGAIPINEQTIYANADTTIPAPAYGSGSGGQDNSILMAAIEKANAEETPSAATSPYKYTANADGVNPTDLVGKEEVYQPEPAGVQSLAGNSWDEPQPSQTQTQTSQPETARDEMTTSTIMIGGQPVQVSEARKDRIENQRAANKRLRTIEKRNYDKTKSFARKHPRLAKKAMAGFKDWRKNFRSSYNVNNEITAEGATALAEQVERNNATYWNTMGYDKNGKPFYNNKEVTRPANVHPDAMLDSRGNPIIKPFPTRNNEGIETTNYYPVRANGSPITDGRNPGGGNGDGGNGDQPGIGVKLPKLSQKDEDDYKSMLRTIKPMQYMANNFDKDYVGPFDSRFQGTKSNLGQGSAGYNTFEQKLAGLTNIARHELFGSVLTKGEIESWEKQAPTMLQNETEFVPKFNSFVDTSIGNAEEAMNRFEAKGMTSKAQVMRRFIEDLEKSKISGSKGGNVPSNGMKLNDGSIVFPDGSRVDANGNLVK